MPCYVRAHRAPPARGLGVAWAFLLLLVCRLISARVNLIHDCDEVYNYWEPLHFLLYGSGMQTWEYRCPTSAGSLNLPGRLQCTLGLSFRVVHEVRRVAALPVLACSTTLRARQTLACAGNQRVRRAQRKVCAALLPVPASARGSGGSSRTAARHGCRCTIRGCSDQQLCLSTGRTTTLS